MAIISQHHHQQQFNQFVVGFPLYDDDYDGHGNVGFFQEPIHPLLDDGTDNDEDYQEL